jgi:hypothetical protein
MDQLLELEPRVAATDIDDTLGRSPYLAQHEIVPDRKLTTAISICFIASFRDIHSEIRMPARKEAGFELFHFYFEMVTSFDGMTAISQRADLIM